VSAVAAARILTVEDDPIVQADLRLLLEDAGFDVCAGARDGIEAVDLARHHRPDLVLIDLGLPRMDGVEATRQILREQTIPILALTGRGGTASVEQALAAGAVGHVRKPFAAADLVHTITDALSHRAALDRSEPVAAERQRYRELATIESMLREDRSDRDIRERLSEQFGGNSADQA
jgi:CheY-like chemotaxis protein